MCELRAHYSLALLTVSYLVGEMGHFLLGATSRAMARELEYGDEACLCDDQLEQEECLEAGCHWDYTGRGMDYQVLAGPTFILVFSVSGLLFGLAADYTNRMRLLGGAVCLFSSAILLTSVSTSYWELVLARMLLAAGESACSPVCVSLISDLYPDHQHGLATGVLHLGVYLGFGLSQAAGIYLTQMDILGYSWRAPYFITGVPGIIIGVLLLLLRDPRTMEGKCKTEELLTDLKEKDERPQRSADVSCLKENLLTPFMLVMFLAAAARHSAGFTWAYNCRLYFLR